MTLRGEKGVFIQYKMIQILGLAVVKECEALALLEAMMWVHSMGHERVIF